MYLSIGGIIYYKIIFRFNVKSNNDYQDKRGGKMSLKKSSFNYKRLNPFMNSAFL